MANITYSRTFRHDDWIDNEDVVQAGGEKGFNKKFHDLEAEFNVIASVISEIATAIGQIQRVRHVKALAAQTVAPGAVSPEFDIEQYATAEVPANTQKIYFTSQSFLPPNTPGQVETFTYYRPGPNDTIRVFMVFKNTGTAAVTFITQVFSIS